MGTDPQFPLNRVAPGDKVKVVDGTFVGLEGIILSPNEVVRFDPEARISHEVREGKVYWVLLPMFDKKVPVELEPWQLAHSVASGESEY
jgi:transcription antitermination factor NusG